MWKEGCDDRPRAQCPLGKESNADIDSFDNPYGLYNALAIWAAAVEKRAVGLADDVEETKKDISKCLAMLLLCGIDPIFYSGSL